MSEVNNMTTDSDAVTAASKDDEIVLLSDSSEAQQQPASSTTPSSSPPPSLFSNQQSPIQTGRRPAESQLTSKVVALADKAINAPPSAVTTPTHRSQLLYETIETHFINNGEIYFVVYNAEAGRKIIKAAQPSKEILYSVKPVWYMAGTLALRAYYSKLNKAEKALVPVTALADDPHAARPMRKLLVNMRSCSVGPATGDQKTRSGKMDDFSLYVPADWGQLAYHRLSHYKIDSVLACAKLSTDRNDGSDEGQSETVVYLVRWQNESLACNELLPAEYLRAFAKHDKHHQMILDYWDECCVKDLRDFRSAATISYSKQNTNWLSNEYDNFWTKLMLGFRARPNWTNSKGKPYKGMQEMYVYKYLGYPLTAGRVLRDELDEDEGDKEMTEKEEDDIDPSGYEEYIHLLIHDKFIETGGAVPAKAEDLSKEEFLNFANVSDRVAHVPRKWRQLSEEHAAQNDQVEILGLFRQMDYAVVYLVKWPTYSHPTLVASITLRKNHYRQMVDYFEQNVYMPRMEVFTSENR